MSDYSDIRDATDCPGHPVPAGWTDEWDTTIWNVGWVFRWSPVFNGWVDQRITLTVKPFETLGDAFERRMDHAMWLDYAIFFTDEG